MSSKEATEDVLLLADLAEATGCVALQTSGQGEIMNVLTPEQVRATLEKIATRFVDPPLKLTPLQRFLKWSVSDRKSRTISPFSELTVAEWIEKRINKGALDDLQAAIQLDPANALLVAHFGRCLAEYQEGTDPAEVQRKCAEADFQTRRALKLAPDNDEVKKCARK
jgi:hypothetical protein